MWFRSHWIECPHLGMSRLIWIWLLAKIQMHQGMGVIFSGKLNQVEMETLQGLNVLSPLSELPTSSQKTTWEAEPGFLILQRLPAYSTSSAFFEFILGHSDLLFLPLLHQNRTQNNRSFRWPIVLSFNYTLQSVLFEVCLCVSVWYVCLSVTLCI